MRVVQLRWLDEGLNAWREVTVVDKYDPRPDEDQLADLRASGHGSQSPPHELRVVEIADDVVAEMMAARARGGSTLHTVAEELFYSRHHRFPSR
jgi:hypothetical protein